LKAIVFDIRLNSLYSIRVPFTWQSALTYPILPPSAVIGMIANALQRFKNDNHPLEYLKLVEDNVIWAGSRLLTPCVIKSYTTSAIVKWEDKLGGKFTNALGRQFGYSKNLRVLTIFKDETLVEEISKAVKSTPLTCGDSESPISIESEIKIVDAKFVDKTKDLGTNFPIPFSKKININGTGRLFLVHERCMKREDSLPLKSYVFPIKENKGILEHSPLIINLLDNGFKVIEIDEVGLVVLEERKDKPEKKTKRKPRKKK
jgi:CRISPR-associated Cas5-like protein